MAVTAEVLYSGNPAGPHDIVMLGKYWQPGFKPVQRVGCECACGWTATTWPAKPPSEPFALALAAYDEHTHPGLAEAYLPYAPLPWKDSP